MRFIHATLRPTLRIEVLLILVVSYLIAALNGSWWNAALAGRSPVEPASWLFGIAVFVVLVALHFVLLAPVANRWTVRPLLTVTVVASAAVAYFMRTFAVMMDPTMIQNVLKTDVHEARDLISLSMVGSVLLWSAIPLVFIWSVRIAQVSWPLALVVRIGSMLAAFLIAVLAFLLISRDLTSLMRNQRELRYLITPGNYIYGLSTTSAREVGNVSRVREAVGTDAHLVGLAISARKPRVFVLVVGETARAANFALLGYQRATTPELAKTDVTVFRNVTACGTSTEVSLPCMFSQYGREDYDERRIRNSEGLLNVLARAGYSVTWVDNQSGCKGVCRGAGIGYEKIDPKVLSALCAGDECYDEVLVQRLQLKLANVRGDSVIVLHMMGNHGPAYFRRYPPSFRRFTPDCETAELRQCSREEVVNAYDNAILYTDHVLASVVQTLAGGSQAFDAALLYVSDHGESLGENGMYLHGIPYSIAPRLQTQVPMITWLSPGFASANHIESRCLRAKAGEPLSHDNLFHSVLGLLNVQTSVYRPDRDFFSSCRQPAGRAIAQIGAKR